MCLCIFKGLVSPFTSWITKTRISGYWKGINSFESYIIRKEFWFSLYLCLKPKKYIYFDFFSLLTEVMYYGHSTEVSLIRIPEFAWRTNTTYNIKSKINIGYNIWVLNTSISVSAETDQMYRSERNKDFFFFQHAFKSGNKICFFSHSLIPVYLFHIYSTSECTTTPTSIRIKGKEKAKQLGGRTQSAELQHTVCARAFHTNVVLYD